MFELTIKCTKDIDEIHIDFSDGTSVIKSKPKNSRQESRIKTHDDEILDTRDYGNSDVFTETVEKPIIKEQTRPVKVASELQNLDL